MSADLTVPPLPVVARVSEDGFSGAGRAVNWLVRGRGQHKGAQLVYKADAEAALASLQAELKQAREVAAFMRAATRDAQEFAADAQDKAASLQARLEAAERLARYGALVLNEHRANGPCDVDGGTLQDLAVQAGALEARQVTEPCGENCECACITDFPTECYFLAAGVRAAIDAATQEGK